MGLHVPPAPALDPDRGCPLPADTDSPGHPGHLREHSAEPGLYGAAKNRRSDRRARAARDRERGPEPPRQEGPADARAGAQRARSLHAPAAPRSGPGEAGGADSAMMTPMETR